MKRSELIVLFTAVLLPFTAGCPQMGDDGGGGSDQKSFIANLDGAQETPPIVVGGVGQGAFTLNIGETALAVSVEVSGLTGAITAAHIHRGGVGVAGPPIVTLSDFTTNNDGSVNITGSWDLSAADLVDLEAGDLYVNVHTAANPGGEIRGQIIPDAAG